MGTLVSIVHVSIYALMAVIVTAAVCAVTLSNLFHAALALIVVLLGIAGMYLSMHADFLAVVQILLYVGAVMTLIIFAVMLTQKLGGQTIRQENNLSIPALLGSTALFLVLFKFLDRPNWPAGPVSLPAPTAKTLGEALMGNYVFPFEIVSVILIVVLIGAVIIAKHDKENS